MRHLKKLSPFEIKIIEMICDGYSNTYIAERFGLHKTTIRNYVANILLTVSARNRTELAMKYTRFIDKECSK
ncbi:MAG TPA: LuxR C-terminal-related transcriptional regulator [Ruminiclostridium sp.]